VTASSAVINHVPTAGAERLPDSQLVRAFGHAERDDAAGSMRAVRHVSSRRRSGVAAALAFGVGPLAEDSLGPLELAAS